ncbi:urotensin-2B [Erethizon dorsatum]
MKIFSTSLCFGLLPLLSVIILLESVHGRPYLAQGNELFPDEDTNHEELLLALLSKNFDLQRPSKKDVELDNKLEEFNQQIENLKGQLTNAENLKGQLTNAKQAEISYAINGLSSSHPNKRACFWKYCV